MKYLVIGILLLILRCYSLTIYLQLGDNLGELVGRRVSSYLNLISSNLILLPPQVSEPNNFTYSMIIGGYGDFM